MYKIAINVGKSSLALRLRDKNMKSCDRKINQGHKKITLIEFFSNFNLQRSAIRNYDSNSFKNMEKLYYCTKQISSRSTSHTDWYVVLIFSYWKSTERITKSFYSFCELEIVFSRIEIDVKVVSKIALSVVLILGSLLLTY